MNATDILRHIDHTQLKATASWDDIQKLCEEAIQYGTASVCIPPCYVKEAADYLKGRIPVCTGWRSSIRPGLGQHGKLLRHCQGIKLRLLSPLLLVLV